MELTPLVKPNLSSSVKQFLYDYIRQEDQKGAEKLPPENQLAERMKVSRVTIRRALDELEREGMIIRLHGRGTFINRAAVRIKVNLMPGEEFSRLIRKCGYMPACRLLGFRLERPDEKTSRILQTGTDEKIYVVERLFFADGRPAIISIDRFPSALLGENVKRQEIEGRSTFDFLKEKAGSVIVRDKVDMEVLPAGSRALSEAASNLECDQMLVFHGINYDQDNQPVIYDTEYYDTKYIRFSFLRIKDVYDV